MQLREQNEQYEEDQQYQEDQQQYEGEEQEYDDNEEQKQEKENINTENSSNNTKYSTKSKLSTLLPGLKDDPELEDERKNLWKAFGRESGAGKVLFSLYKSHQAPKINYPKLKTKVRQPEVKVQKKCPQKTQIEYPDLPQKPRRKFHQIDFVMRRKPEWQIKEEIDIFFSRRQAPLNRGVNRKELINNLQDKFKDQRGGLPKGIELPKTNIYTKDIELSEDQKTQAMKRVSKRDKNFTNIDDDDQKTSTTIYADPIEELEAMFETIMKEIEERQEMLEEIKDIKDGKLREQLKKDIVEKVSELQKVTELKKYYKEKSNEKRFQK